MFGLSIFAVMGFAALAVDISYHRTAQAQAQDVADAASQAATMVIRRTGDQAEAAAVVQQVLAYNQVAGAPATLEELTFGIWNQPYGEAGVFEPTNVNPNAARVQISQEGSYFLARVLGFFDFTVTASSTSATRNLHVILLVDITNSWHPSNFLQARYASLAFLDIVQDSAGPHDKIGMSVFSGRYAWEFTPLTDIRDTDAMAGVNADWSELKTASKAGTSNWPSTHCSTNNDNFSSPFNGCYPNMPREYLDEPGTDHTTGLTQARQMFEEQPDQSAFRALIVLTDGQPADLSGSNFKKRGQVGYVEDRWREFVGPIPHSANDIRNESIDLAGEMWDDLRVHTWVVSFVADDWFMPEMVQGQGYYARTSNASALIPIFEDIANSLPLAIVE